MNLLGSIVSQVPAFTVDEKTHYTFRYVFYRKADLESGSKNACFSMVTGLWKDHEAMYERINSDDTISSCIVEYVCEYDSALCGVVGLVKSNENLKEDKKNA